MFITKDLHKFFAASLLVALIVVAFVVNNTVYAQSNGLGFTPRKDVSVQAGKSVDGNLYVTNLDKKAVVNLRVQIVDFTSANQTGSVTLVTDKSADPTPWSLRPFIKVPETLVLQPGESKQVPFTVAIPKNQGAGSYYGVVQYVPESDTSQEVTVNASGGTMVFVTVPGKAREQMSLQQFGAYELDAKKQTGSFKSLFTNTTPMSLAYVVRNTGNVAESPAGSIEITNIFGKRVRVINNANPHGNLALIGQERRIEVCIESGKRVVRDNAQNVELEYCKKPRLLPGVYKAHLNVFYGINGSNTQEIDKTVVFWYVPYWSVGVLLVILAVLAFGLYRLRDVYGVYKAKRKA